MIGEDGHRLVLFDIDGTLLSAGRASREALTAALREIHPEPVPLDGYDFSGKTDPQIVRELLAPLLPEPGVAKAVPAVLERYLAHLPGCVARGTVTLKPGVRALVERLAAEPRITLGLLTGNLERGARAKLAPTGLSDAFRFGAFGSDDADRYRLPAVALERARRHAGRAFRGKEIVIVGDSVHDVGCGRGISARSIAVATGPTPAERLRAEAPDYLFSDLSDTGAVAEAMLC